MASRAAGPKQLRGPSPRIFSHGSDPDAGLPRFSNGKSGFSEGLLERYPDHGKSVIILHEALFSR